MALIANLAQNNADMAALLDQQSEPVYHILDWSAVQQLNLEAMATAAASAAWGENAVFHHPMIKEVLFVTTNPIFAQGAEGLKTETYGSVPISVFSTLDEALQYARAQIRKSR